MFDPQGHKSVTATQFFASATADVRTAVKDLCLSGTPSAFSTFTAYRAFLDAVSTALGIHPRAIVVRGSAHLGFSTSPKPHKIWKAFRRVAGPGEEISDIDIAIVDLPYFDQMNREILNWEERQGGEPLPNSPRFRRWLRRADYRHYNLCADDDSLPPNTCMRHVNAIGAIDTAPFCAGIRHGLSAFVFRDWWSLQNRCEYDLRTILRLVQAQAISAPPALAGPPPPAQVE